MEEEFKYTNKVTYEKNALLIILLIIVTVIWCSVAVLSHSLEKELFQELIILMSLITILGITEYSLLAQKLKKNAKKNIKINREYISYDNGKSVKKILFSDIKAIEFERGILKNHWISVVAEHENIKLTTDIGRISKLVKLLYETFRQLQRNNGIDEERLLRFYGYCLKEECRCRLYRWIWNLIIIVISSIVTTVLLFIFKNCSAYTFAILLALSIVGPFLGYASFEQIIINRGLKKITWGSREYFSTNTKQEKKMFTNIFLFYAITFILTAINMIF